ncbi:hypothetical protein [Moorena sp. SIO4E2]|nr:hypothetical protein [Moorena sp. SIO4E2]
MPIPPFQELQRLYNIPFPQALLWLIAVFYSFFNEMQPPLPLHSFVS